MTAIAASADEQRIGSDEDDPSDVSQPETDVIVVYGRALEQIGIAVSGSQGTVGYADFETLPISRTGELVENVPGVIATQHSGTGKANQYFLRGFNLDHGTDFAGFVDGVPINMRTHGHGQGYLDFNFVIPETIERIDYRKGPYFADVGDFSGAGTVAFKTYDTLRPFAQVTLGEFGYYRGTAAGSTPLAEGNLLLAFDGTFSNGPWVRDENLEKYNALLKYNRDLGDDRFSVQLNGYHARWDSTDQIPERAVESGLIDRFGFIDDDLGGETTRFGLVANGSLGGAEFNAFATYYDLVLTSNFTYFLDDPVDGDEFQQQDRRYVFGGSASKTFTVTAAPLPMKLTIGGDLRYDAIENVGLFESVGAVPTNTIRRDQVDEFSGALYLEGEFDLTERFRAYLGVRGDLMSYDVNADLSANSGSGSDTLLSPKAALAWRPVDSLELYANYGESFHSNDVRGATISIDPASGDPADRVPVFVRARGAELGARFERPNFTASLVGFYLGLDSELVFVGDAGTTEPNDATRRYGVEATAFWRPATWLTLDAAYAYTDAEFRDVAPGLTEIPGAVADVLSAGISAAPMRGLDLTMRLRHFGEAPLIEDGSVTSDPTTLVNLGAFYSLGSLRAGIEVFNLFDANDADITYFYESQLASENTPVADRHFHPVEPRQFRFSLRYRF
ncbi:TonB-dependent receptor [Qipengyuania qiaonensis]|uniref:TonB-dependent receptor n=1 Tax=Qipengyuania qiaonensis TaxID=2867240 RepID=UPI0031EF5420